MQMIHGTLRWNGRSSSLLAVRCYLRATWAGQTETGTYPGTGGGREGEEEGGGGREESLASFKRDISIGEMSDHKLSCRFSDLLFFHLLDSMIPLFPH